MIDIEITSDAINEDEVKKLKDIEELKGIVIHTRADLFEYTEDSAHTGYAIAEAIRNKFCSSKGYHFAIDSKGIIECVPDNKQTEHIFEGKDTFINRAMYNNKANESSISVIMLFPQDQKYEDIERKTVKFIADYLVKKNLEPKHVMRGFDLNKFGSPLHLLEKNKWRKFIKLIEDTYEAMMDKENEYNDDKLEKATTTYTDKELRDFYLDNGADIEKYAKDFEPDHRDIEEIVNFKSNEPSEIKSFTTENNTNFTYSVVENVPTSTGHCSRAFDTLTAKATPNNLEVEPIYPDLAVPPGGTITLLNSSTESKPIQSNSVPLSVEEFDNREKAFNIKDYVGAVKKIEGKPVNNNDPFPTDDKIKELESHMPKVKIDEVAFNFHDCNHPDSIIGPAVASNFAMIQDEIITMAKRTERRLVKLENILSTVMRNLFRTASRMQVNCVYYGGQDVYGKYKCIRCLHNDRINDGQSMTLDQCLSCTRYEPILGQVYAILDDTGANVAQVLDDIQMSYMSMEEYIAFTRTEEMHVERDPAKLNTEATQPKPFSEFFEEGFKMDWNPTPLEAQRHNVAEYKTEGIQAVKPVIEKENEPVIEDEFKNVVEETEAYETLKYDSNNYSFENFGTESDLGISGLYGGGSEIRKKIVEYAENGLKLCHDGKGRYTMNTNSANGPTRYNHNDKAVNGIHYWDCSSFCEAAYKHAGLTSIAGNTKTEYPMCLPSTGGIIIPHTEEDKALPGDLVWFTSQEPKPSTQEELTQAILNKIGHVGIYIGNGEYIHASTNNAPITEHLKKSPTKNWDKRIFAFGRPKELVEADKKAAELTANGEGFFDYDSHGFNSTITALANKYCEGQVKSVIDNMNKYGYKQAVIDISKKHGLDPYFVLGLIATESAGDPTNKTGYYWGIMQTSKENTRATGNLEDIKHDLEVGCAHYHKIRNYMKKPRGENQVLATYAYNAGNGTVDEACNNYGPGADTVKAGPIAQYVADSAIRRYGPSKQDECTSYVAKIILRANMLRAKNALG